MTSSLVIVYRRGRLQWTNELTTDLKRALRARKKNGTVDPSTGRIKRQPLSEIASRYNSRRNRYTDSALRQKMFALGLDKDGRSKIAA